ncbi:MAG TPA: glutathione S-transferase family protein [Minicystis sp.]|nr:glutathione S-transferase family protein [Minicystis sp.]
MGQLVDGVWHEGWYEPDARGAFQRPPTRFRGRVGEGEHPVEPGRYHLYASYACPWAHRTLVTRAVRGLDAAVGLTIVDPKMGEGGWAFSPDDPDPVTQGAFLRDVYLRADAHYTGRVTVPVLFDTKTGTIVNNESREVMRMFDTSFDALARGPSLAPAALRDEIDRTLDALYQPLNNGVYRAGFATTQSAYEHACRDVFAALDHWDAVLAQRRYLLGDVLTEADVALFTTCLRFDLVYYAHFKCNVRRLADYENVWGLVRELYQTEAVRPTCRLDHIKTHYYWSQTTVNPHRIVPLGPTIDYDRPHGRDRAFSRGS